MRVHSCMTHMVCSLAPMHEHTLTASCAKNDAMSTSINDKIPLRLANGEIAASGGIAVVPLHVWQSKSKGKHKTTTSLEEGWDE